MLNASCVDIFFSSITLSVGWQKDIQLIYCMYVQELAADQQVGRVSMKQSSLARSSSVGNELSTVMESPHKPTMLTLDLSSPQSTSFTADTDDGADVATQNTQS